MVVRIAFACISCLIYVDMVSDHWSLCSSVIDSVQFKDSTKFGNETSVPRPHAGTVLNFGSVQWSNCKVKGQALRINLDDADEDRGA